MDLIKNLISFRQTKIALDLGTVNTLVAIDGYGIVLNEATAVAISEATDDGSPLGNIVAFGTDAIEMCGRMPNGMKLRFPFRNGVIADYYLSEYMIKHFIEKALLRCKIRQLFVSPKILLCVPNCITEVERHALKDAAKNAGASEVLIIEEVMAACVGAGINFREPVGHMLVDIGGGTTDTAVIALGGIASQASIRTGGNDIDEDIISYIRKHYRIIIGHKTAETLKISLSTVFGEKKGQPDKAKKTLICGLSLDTGLPKSVSIELSEIIPALSKVIDKITLVIKDVLQNTPPELAGDIMQSGITLSGGGANLFGLAEEISRVTEIEVVKAKKPMECVAAGAIEILSLLKEKREGDKLDEYSLLGRG